MTQFRFITSFALIILIFTLFPAVGRAEPLVLETIHTDIIGKTNRSALLKELLIHEGQEFKSYSQLDNLVRARLKNLLRRRLFAEVNWQLLFKNPTSVVLYIRVVDSHTLYPRPVIRYSSDNSIMLGLKLEYLNAFGALTDNVMETYWSPKSILLQFQVRRIILGAMHLNTVLRLFDGTTRYGNQQGGTDIEFRYKETYASAGLEIPLGRKTAWIYLVEPSLSGLYDYRFVINTSDESNSQYDNSGFVSGLDHGVLLDTVEWKANFRRGVDFRLLNRNQWYTGSSRSLSVVELDTAVFQPLAPWLALSGRIGGFYAFEGTRTNAGDRIRGVLDYATYGQWGGYVNIQTNFKVLHIRDSFEIQIAPFFDIGYVLADKWGYTDDGWETGVGFSSMVYISALPSLVVNFDFGWDLKRNTPEITIDTRQFF